METNVIKLGNSQGIIIPAKLLKILGLKDKVNLQIEGGKLLIAPIEKEPRAGWEERIRDEIQKEGQPEKLMPDFFEDETTKGWQW